MDLFLFTCPIIGMKVQGWTAETPATNDNFEAIQCTACQHVHLVNPVTGRVAGEGGNKFAGWRKDD
jgi:hypothetical protein